MFILLFMPLSFTGGYFLGFQNKNISIEIINNKNYPKSQETDKHQNNPEKNLHYSYFSQKDFFDGAFKNASCNDVAKENIKGLVVPHHLLASRLIACAFLSVSSEKPKTIVLISPNHFFAGNGQIISSIYDWQTPYGILESDKNLTKQLQESQALTIDEIPFEKEHGISSIVPFIKNIFPESKIIPIIIKDNLSEEKSDIFAENLLEILPPNSLVVTSLDFSHYLPSNAADFHDSKSISVLENFDYGGIKFMDIDSRPATRIFLKYLDLSGAKKFNFLDNSNSAKILNDKTTPETTSYITGFYSQENNLKNEKTPITILAFGDLMLDRYIRKVTEEKGYKYPFKNIERFLGGNDITFANLEGSFTDFDPKPLNPNNLTFTFDPAIVPTLQKTGFNLFNLANNHSLNFGKEGLNQSRQYLQKNLIDYFGDPLNIDSISMVKEIRGIKTGFIGYNEFGNANIDKIITEIKNLRQSVDFMIVYTHWGMEYQSNFSKSQQNKARQFIDAGADVILGSHPHVIQPIEIYKNKAIFYSLGNFLFDQTFSQKTQQGLGVGIDFSKLQINYYLFPIETKNLQISLIGSSSSIILKELSDMSIVSENTKNQIIDGKITINQ